MEIIIIEGSIVIQQNDSVLFACYYIGVAQHTDSKLDPEGVSDQYYSAVKHKVTHEPTANGMLTIKVCSGWVFSYLIAKSYNYTYT